MKNAKLFLAIALTTAAICGARAADLGDPAAALKIAHWVKGEPVQVTEGGDQVYVVEFWATWCPPCRTSIPHLSDIQKEFKDRKVVVVGISDEPENVVAPFVKEWSGKMEYRVAIDDARQTSAGYMKAYGMNGIPHAFIVQKGKVIWHGHPMAGLDRTLEEITSGRYDVDQARAQFKVDALYAQFREAAAAGEEETADRLAKDLQAAAGGTRFPLTTFDPEREKREIRSQMLARQFQSALYQDQQEQANLFEAKLKAIDPAVDLHALREEVQINRMASGYLELLGTSEKASDELKTKGEELAAGLKGHPFVANEVAWQILTGEGLKYRDVPLALKIAKQACEDSKWLAPHVVDTYARALFDSGKKEEAIEYQIKAISVAGENKASYEQTLESYRAGKAP